MKLIFIYGPPASGKLTIAEELVKLCDYKLFHNHLTQDLAQEIYPEFDEVRGGLVDKIRLDIFEYAAQRNTDLVFTFAYVGEPVEDKFIASAVEIVERNSGQVCFVQLSAPDNVLLERVNNESRRQFHKLTKVDQLKEYLDNDKYRGSVHQPEIYKLDTSKQGPAESAKSIQDHYKL